MADVSKVNVNSTDYNIKDSNAMHKGVDRVTAGQSIIAPIGTASTADGYSVNASGDYSHASGYHTIASSDMQHVIGKYNEEDANDTYAFIVGGGRLDFDRKNIFTIDWNGDVNAGRSNGLTNDTKLPTGADVISYLNSKIGDQVTSEIYGSIILIRKGKMRQLIAGYGLMSGITNQTIPSGDRPPYIVNAPCIFTNNAMSSQLGCGLMSIDSNGVISFRTPGITPGSTDRCCALITWFLNN